MKATSIVDDDQWLHQRRQLLEKEKELARLGDELAEARRQMGWRRVRKGYYFETLSGQASLLDLFGDHDQLIVQHLMFAPEADEGCPMCSFWADGYDAMITHMHQRNANFVAVSRAPLEKLSMYQARMGWSFPWVSCGDSDFNYDFDVTATEDEMAEGTTQYNYRDSPTRTRDMPGISVFARDGEEIYHTYSTYARGLDRLNAAYAYIDLLPRGRNEGDLPFPMAWVRRHDTYG